LARTYVGADESKNFQAAVAGETELRGKAMVEYNSAAGMKKYRYLYNAWTASRAAGLPCNYDMSHATYPGGVVVTQPTTGNLGHLAGVHAESITSGAWGWVQVEGYHSAVPTRTYGSSSGTSAAALDYVSGCVNGVDALSSLAATICVTATGCPVALGMGYAIRLAAQTSHGTSTTTSNAGVYIHGFIVP
jgi:hypothetical protein